MTEMVNGEGQNFNNSSAGIPVTPASSAPPAPSEERTFRQAEVNDLIGKARSEAVERYKRETSMPSHTPNYGYQPPQQQSQPYQPPYGGQGQQPNYPQQPNLTADQVKQMMAEESRKSREEWILEQRRNSEQQNAQRIASDFFTKVGTGEGGVDGFYKMANDAGVDLQSIPFHIQLATQVENTKEVMEDLIKNPIKIGQLQNLINIDMEAHRAGRNSNLAYAEMKRLADSIKMNQGASKYQSPNEPLSQMRPSNAGTGNQGALTVGDYKRKYRV